LSFANPFSSRYKRYKIDDAAVTDSTSRIRHSDIYTINEAPVWRNIMKTLFAMAATGTLLLSGIASAQEFPVYELSGFPTSPHQISVMGATANVKERPSGTSLTMGGMPASPLQVLVLAPRQKV
jgi:hypothetical protein